MDRRIAGALLPARALMTLVCVPAVVGRHVAGTASPVPMPDWLSRYRPGAVAIHAEPVSCSAPRSSQLPAAGVVDGTTSVLSASLAVSYRKYATAVLDGLDPEVADRLTVRVAAQGIGPQILLCSVWTVGPHQLFGSVPGIGTRPLPLTG